MSTSTLKRPRAAAVPAPIPSPSSAAAKDKRNRIGSKFNPHCAELGMIGRTHAEDFGAVIVNGTEVRPAAAVGDWLEIHDVDQVKETDIWQIDSIKTEDQILVLGISQMDADGFKVVDEKSFTPRVRRTPPAPQPVSPADPSPALDATHAPDARPIREPRAAGLRFFESAVCNCCESVIPAERVYLSVSQPEYETVRLADCVACDTVYRIAEGGNYRNVTATTDPADLAEVRQRRDSLSRTIRHDGRHDARAHELAATAAKANPPLTGDPFDGM